MIRRNWTNERYRESKKKGKIINFVNRSKQNKKIQTDRDEFERLDALAKELVDVYYKLGIFYFLVP